MCSLPFYGTVSCFVAVLCSFTALRMGGWGGGEQCFVCLFVCFVSCIACSSELLFSVVLVSFMLNTFLRYLEIFSYLFIFKSEAPEI